MFIIFHDSYHKHTNGGTFENIVLETLSLILPFYNIGNWNETLFNTQSAKFFNTTIRCV